MAPYIILSQPYIIPDVLGEVLDEVWDMLSDEQRERLLETLDDYDVKYEK